MKIFLNKFHFYIISFFIAFSNLTALAIDEPDFILKEKIGDIEIREYKESFVAEVVVKGNRKNSASVGFRKLFKYIKGENKGNVSIPMTAPVIQENPLKEGNADLLTQEKIKDNKWKVSFYMPNGIKSKDIPKPKDPDVSIKRIPPYKSAVIRFSGNAEEENIKKNDKKLRAYLKSEGLSFEDSAILAQYNPPFTPWFLRRNELIYRLK